MIRLLLAFAAAAPPLHFDRLPLGSVARVMSARFQASITILANATAPISGDFSEMPIAQALTLIAAQAGMVARPDATGFVIGPAGRSATSGRADSTAGPIPTQPAPSAAEQRANLLRRRTELLQQAAKLSPP